MTSCYDRGTGDHLRLLSIVRKTVSFAVLACLVQSALCEEGSKSYAIRRWGMKDGLPLNKIRAITQTRDGYLWIATFNGLAQFDGVRFKVFDVGNSPGLNNNAIECLCEDQLGRLWVGDHMGRVVVLTRGRFEAVSLPPSWPSRPILRMAAGADGTLWVMNDGGEILPIADCRALRPLSVSASLVALCADNRGTAWCVVGDKFCSLDRDRGAIPHPNGPRMSQRWRAIFPSRKGGLCFLDGERLGRWTPEKGCIEERDGGDWGKILLASFIETSTGTIAGGSFKEGVRLLAAAGSSERLDESNGLSQNWAYCLFEDREGTVWAGTGNGGLNAIYPRRVTMVYAPDDWMGCAVLSVTPSAKGGLWIGTEGGGVYRLRDTVVERFSGGEGFWHSVVNSVMEDNDGTLWTGTWSSTGAIRRMLDGKMEAAFPAVPGHSVVFTLFQSSSGEIWAGTRDGLGRGTGDRWEWLEQVQGIKLGAVRCIAETRDRRLWFGFDGKGIGCLENGRFRCYTTRDGLVNDYVRTLHPGPDGSLWIGTRGGVSRLLNGRFGNVTTKQGLPNDVICQILEDRAGHVWMSSFGGLFRVSQKELNRCADGELKSLNVVVCDYSGGLSTLEVSEQGQPAGCATPDGQLWFATGRGLAKVNPEIIKPNILPPPVHIVELLVDGTPVDLPVSDGDVRAVPKIAEPANRQTPARIRAGAKHLELRYTAISLANPAHVRFRHKLEGLDQEWMDVGMRRSAFYTQLRPGDYFFRVIARNADGVWNEQGASIGIRVLPHYWQTISFKLASVLGGAGATAAALLTFVRRRTRRKLEALEWQRAIESERTRIARDIHDELGSSLTRIVMLSESAQSTPGQTAQASADLEEIALTGRNLTRQLSETVWAVNPAHDNLDSFATYIGKYAHDFLRATGIRCRLNLPLSLPDVPLASPVRHNLLMAFKEALNNSVKYAKAASVLVELEMRELGFTLTIKDDGPGMDPAAPRSGHGIENMKRRMSDVGGHFSMETGPSGTAIRLFVPFNNCGPHH